MSSRPLTPPCVPFGTRRFSSLRQWLFGSNQRRISRQRHCNKLFALERKFDELNLTHEERAERRMLESKPVTEAFFAWVESMLPKILPKSKLGQAITYAVNQRTWLMNFLLDGRLELSNNRAERTIRPFTVGRKNWLFSYCARGAKASAIVYSIIETAQANGLVPFMYLNYLFTSLPNISPDKFTDCLPWNPLVQNMCKIPTIALFFKTLLVVRLDLTLTFMLSIMSPVFLNSSLLTNSLINSFGIFMSKNLLNKNYFILILANEILFYTTYTTFSAPSRTWLMNFLLDGRLELSNNRAERTIRPFAVGRKNWLFFILC